jgi:lysophospholipase L1-like esterase
MRLSNFGTLARLGIALVCSSLGCAANPLARISDAHWVGIWMAAPQLTEPRNLPPSPGLAGSTLRQVVHLAAGGARARLRISNEFGDGDLRLDAVHLARSTSRDSIDATTDVALRFAGEGAVTIPPGTAVESDVFVLPAAPLDNVAISVHVVASPPGVTGHPGSRATSYLAAGDQTRAPALTGAVPVEHWYLITRVDVMAPTAAASVVVLGNSIADGRGSGTDRNTRWPDNLRRRLQQDARTVHVAVLNAGIGGNAVVRGGLGPPAVERFERDVLASPGVRWVIVSEGVNDIGGARGADSSAAVAENLMAAYAALIARAHRRGLQVYGATILPFGGSFYDNPDREAARQRVNAWIRAGNGFDAVIDFDAAMRDPVAPSRLRAEADGGDHLHPNEAGYRMMAAAIDLALFRSTALRRGMHEAPAEAGRRPELPGRLPR